MNSTGNDIVSLNAINRSRTKQPGFYSKILSASEQLLYNEPEFAAIPFEHFVWLLWSIKESAFKYLQRSNPDLIFSPTKFIVQQLQMPPGYGITNLETTETEGNGFDSRANHVKGMIKVGTATLYSRSIIYKELISSVVNGNDNFENTSWGIKLISKSHPSFQSTVAREFLVDRLSRLFQMDNCVIGKSSDGFPIVLEGKKELRIPVSLSHHDRLVAYSFQSDDF